MVGARYQAMGIKLAASTVVWLVMPEVGVGQLVTELIDLRAGWNAVWLNLEPEPSALDEILAQQEPPLDYEAIWTFDANRAVSGTDGGRGRWLFHDQSVPPSLSTLRALHGHRGYLIKMRSGGRLHLSGRPLIRGTLFTSRVSNLFGALVEPGTGFLSFEEFFSHPNAVGKIRANTPTRHDVFALSSDTLVRKRLSDPIQPNEAYWLNVVQDFEYPGPLDVTASANGLSFGKSTSLRTLTLEVPSSKSARVLTLQARPCVVLSADGECSAGGESLDWLEYREAEKDGLPVWRPLSAGLTIMVPPGGTLVELELRARRAGLEARRRRGEAAAENFPLLLDVSDDEGSRVVLSADVSVEPIFGRWVGRAELNRVSTHPRILTVPLEEAEAPPMGMTLLLDLPDPSSVQAGAVPRLLDSTTVETFRDGRALVQRFESVLFDRPVELTPDPSDPLDPFGGAGTLRGTVRILPDDPLNPYRHWYNPEHRRGYDITREITIKIESQKERLSEQLAGLDGTFGPHRLSGQYTEVIMGVTEQPITVHGNFRLDRLTGGPSPR